MQQIENEQQEIFLQVKRDIISLGTECGLEKNQRSQIH